MEKILILLIFVSLLITACATKKEETAPEIKSDSEVQEEVVQKVETPEVFTYGQAADEFILRLNAEPSLIGDSLVRLAGVVAGRAVVVEVAGRGRFLKTGSDFCGYLVQAIGQDYVRLEVKAR